VPREAIDDEYYNKSIEQTGYSPTVWDFLYDSELAKLSKIDYTYAFQGNNLIRYGQDPETGELVTDTYSAEELGIPNDVSPEFIENENTGEYIWFDKNAPVDENGMLQTNSLGKLKKPASSGGGQQSQWQYTEGVKAGFSLDREDGMTKEDAVNKYGPTLGVDWVNSQYGGTEKEKFDEKFYESQSSEMAEWDKKIKDEPKKYKKIGKEVYRQDFWKDNLVYTYPF